MVDRDLLSVEIQLMVQVVEEETKDIQVELVEVLMVLMVVMVEVLLHMVVEEVEVLRQ